MGAVKSLEVVNLVVFVTVAIVVLWATYSLRHPAPPISAEPPRALPVNTDSTPSPASSSSLPDGVRGTQ